MKYCFVFLFVLCMGATSFSQTGYSQETLDRIKEVENNITGNLVLNEERPSTITERMELHNVKGLSIAVIHQYKIDWAKGYGWADEEEKIPMTTETLFEPGSISKTLNAVGILKLAQDHQLDLYTDINTYLTTWKFPYDSLSKGKKIALAQILTHTAGLSTHGFAGHNIQAMMPTIVDVLEGRYVTSPAVRSVFEPGLEFQYSGGGTTISQLILTDVTGKAYDVWMYENVLKPLGMIHSSYTQPPDKDHQHLCASAYYKNGKKLLNKYHMYPQQAAAGLWMTPTDLCHYIIDMQLAYNGAPSKVLSPEMVKLHLTPYADDGPTAMGTFIIDVDGEKYFEHGAGNDGFCGQFYGSLENGNGVVIFMNSEPGNLLYEVIQSVAKVYGWKNFYGEPKHKNSIPVADSIVKTYEGIYLFDDSWAAIGKEARGYRFHTYGQSARMHFITPTKFFNEEFPSVKEFTKDNAGRITGYTRMIDTTAYPNAIKITNIDTLRLEKGMFVEIGWYFAENGQYKESLVYFKRGLALYPEDLSLLINTANLYLLNGDDKSAITIYKAHLKDEFRPGYSWINMMQDDLIYFKEHYYDAKSFDIVFKKLKIQKPKGY